MRNPVMTSWLYPKTEIICEPEVIGEPAYQGPMYVGTPLGVTVQ